MPTTPVHCPGFDDFKHLSSFVCKCPNCGKEKEIFSDEFEKVHTCSQCHQEIDFTQCTLEGEGGFPGRFCQELNRRQGTGTHADLAEKGL